MILHIDCNTFYASCEVALHPDLQGKPVVVANCNEAGGGIILALTKEAKALGLKRGDPMFKVTKLLNDNNVTVFPANLPKYVDISRRLMRIVREQNIVVNFQQYSVDEFFGELPTNDKDQLREAALKIKHHIEQSTDIPVSCGVSLTYTLGKVATWYAKHYPGYEGVCVLPKDKIEVALNNFPIAEVWGIGRRTAPKLKVNGIDTALQFYNTDEKHIRRWLNINGVYTWKELHGIPSISIDNPERQQSICHSRTFAYMTSDLDTLRTYISDYAVAAARKLRAQHSVCLTVSTFLSTNPFREDLDQYSNMATTKLNVATADSRDICKAAISALEEIYKPGLQYKKAGVILSNITSNENIQFDLFKDPKQTAKSSKLMAALDSLTDKYGMDSVKLAAQGFDKPNLNLTNFQSSQNQSTNINDIIKAK